MPRKALDLETKYCSRCNKAMTRRRFGNRLEDASVFRKRQFCSLTCANTRGNWGTSSTARHRQSHKSVKERCEVCKGQERLHVHHMDGNHHNNALTNLQTLCASCHRKLHSVTLCDHSGSLPACP